MNNDFSSIERLMEFGMSMAVAQQMIATMNHTIGNMTVPGAGTPIRQERAYFAVVDGAQAGPLNEGELRELIDNRRITADTLIWHQGLPAWRVARDICDVNKWLLLSGATL